MASLKKIFSSIPVQVAIIGLAGIIYTADVTSTTNAQTSTQEEIGTLQVTVNQQAVDIGTLKQAVVDIKDSVSDIKADTTATKDSQDELKSYYYSQVLPVLNEIKNKNE